jgi:SGNH domain (fused to AT3 domains)
VYPIPEAGRNVPRYLAKQAMFLDEPGNRQDLTTTYDEYHVRNKETINLFDSIGQYPNLIRIKPEAIFCNTYVKDSCALQLNGASLYRDEFHLSNAGARLVVGEIMKHITRKKI